MDMIEAMKIAVAVARHNSFSSAGRDLRVSAASVSRVVADLEADLGVRLFNRTTRQVNLTDAGREFVHKSSSLLEELDLIRSAVCERHDTPQFCEQYGTPKTLDEIRACPSVTQVSGGWGRVQRFSLNGRVIDFDVPEHFRMNQGEP